MANNSADDTWGRRVRERLAQLSVTQSAFARSIGMSQARFSNYMQGTREPALADFMLIVSALGVSADWILFGGTRPATAVHSTLSAQIEALPPSARRDVEGYLRIQQATAKNPGSAPNNSFEADGCAAAQLQRYVIRRPRRV